MNVFIFHKWTLQLPADASIAPSAENAQPFTMSVCPFNVAIQWWDFTSHNRTVLSSDVDAISVLHGENLQVLTHALWRLSVAMHCWLSTSHNLTVSSFEAVASNLRSLENEQSNTNLLCPFIIATQLDGTLWLDAVMMADGDVGNGVVSVHCNVTTLRVSANIHSIGSYTYQL